MGRQAPSAEELAQRTLANGFRAGAHKVADVTRDQGKHVTKTIRDQDRTLRRFLAFWVLVMEQAQADTPDLPPPTEAMARARYLCQGAPAPDLATIKDFVRFFISLMTPILDLGKNRLTVDSINITAEWFFTGFTRITGTVTDVEDRSKVYSVRTVLTKEGIAVNMRSSKHNLQCVDATRLLRVLWTKDDPIYIPERYRIATWVFNLYCWTGARLSAFFTGGLHYEDVELVLIRHEKNGKNWKLAYKLSQRWIKNNRDPENIVFGAVGNEHDKFIYNGAGFFLTVVSRPRYGCDPQARQTTR